MAVRGYLTVTVNQASSRTKSNEVVWDDSFQEGFVKVEVRGGQRNIKVQSKLQPVVEGALEWQETLKMEVLEDSRELRIVLCRQKRSGTKVGSAVVAACGIFVDDILAAVPIDKWFEMFKPGAAGEGGYIRVHMSFSEDESTPQEADPAAENATSVETRPGIAESFKPQLSGVTSDLQTELQSAQKENRPPLSQGSQTTPSTSAQQPKSDEAVSRESPLEDGPEGAKVDHAAAASAKVNHAEAAPAKPVKARQTVQAKAHERQPAVQNKQNSQKKKKGGTNLVKLVSGVFFVAAAGAAAVYFKQQLDNKSHTDTEYVVVDEDELSKPHHSLKAPHVPKTPHVSKTHHDSED